MKIVHKIAFILLVTGGIAWGFHAFGYNLIDKVLGPDSVVAKIVYVLVALAAVYEIATHKANCTTCKVEKVA